MPLINDLASKGDAGGYTVLGIAVEDSRAAVTEFAKESKLVFPIALDLNSTVKRAYRIFGPPATFFIDGRGIIRDIVLGPITPERAREAMKKVIGTRGPRATCRLFCCYDNEHQSYDASATGRAARSTTGQNSAI
jgi:peroxiredoxin